MKLIVGLGNPGDKYQRTRHNLGFMVIERFLKDFEPVSKTIWEDSKKFKSDIAELEWQPKHGQLQKVILVKPKTFMNNSGLSVSLISQYLNISISDVWVVHDDIDLPLGSMKIRFGGASGGHHGVASIIEKLKTDKFWRFRLGTGQFSSKFNKRIIKNTEDFVLGGFKGSEWGKARELIKRGSKSIQMALEEDMDKAMNRFNTK